MSDRAKEFLERATAGKGETHSQGQSVRVWPTGVEPHIKFEGKTGVATQVVPAGQDPCWDAYLAEAGFGDQIHVMNVTQVRAWQQRCRGEDPIWLRYLRADVVLRRTEEDCLDIDLLSDRISKHKFKRPKDTKAGIALVVNLADWQVGKLDGRGVKGLVEEVMRLIEILPGHIRSLRRSGLDVQKAYLVGMGDLLEGCDGFYAMQTFTVELHRRDQVKVVRRLLVKLIEVLARLVPCLVVACAPGNHGENRKGGKAYTGWGDNDDVAVFEQVAEIFEDTEAYEHVSFVIPKDELTLAFDIMGTKVAFAHGHQFKGKDSTAALRWWKNCEFNGHEIAGADVLVTAHRHHLRVVNSSKRTWIQCPALEDESKWWREGGGGVSPAGTLTFCCGPDWRLGWGRMEIL